MASTAVAPGPLSYDPRQADSHPPWARTDLLDPSHPLEQSIDDPAAAGVRPRLSAVAQHLGMSATGSFQAVGQGREAVEGAIIVDSLSEPHDGRRQPGWIERDGAEGIADDVAEQRGQGGVQVRPGLT